MNYKITWIIDDDPIPRFILTNRLKHHQLSETIYEFEHASELISKLRNKTIELPNLVFLDLNMPVLSGWDFLDIVEQESLFGKFEVEVVIVTSSIDQEDRDKAKTYPCVKHYLTKPVNIDFLISE